VQAEGRYLYDPLGRRVGKQVWKLERDHPDHEQMAFSRKPYVTWYGWEGDRLVTEQTQHTRIQTLYTPGSFTPLLRIETGVAELKKTQRRSLADVLWQDGRIPFPLALRLLLDRLEREIQQGAVSDELQQWLANCRLTVEPLAKLIEPEYTPERKIHLYHCDQRGLPLALVGGEGGIVWQAEYNEWGYQLSENNPHNITQNLRLPGQQYDEESGLHYNRHRYYEPLQGRYITQDPIGLAGGWNLYSYPLNPVINTDSMGLYEDFSAFTSAPGIQFSASDAMFDEPWYANANAYSILSKTHNDMKRLNLAESDQFFHCSAFCRVSKSTTANRTYAIFLGALKEKRDSLLNEFSLYGKGKLSDYDMAMDNAEDLKVNMHGITCPSEEDCSQRCKKYINPKYTETINALRREGYLE
jgi:RHS repeat-associated protein